MGGGRQGESAAPGPGPEPPGTGPLTDAVPSGFAPFEAEEFYDENNAKAEQHKAGRCKLTPVESRVQRAWVQSLEL
jgi:hypothetical protein